MPSESHFLSFFALIKEIASWRRCDKLCSAPVAPGSRKSFRRRAAADMKFILAEFEEESRSLSRGTTMPKTTSGIPGHALYGAHFSFREAEKGGGMLRLQGL